MNDSELDELLRSARVPDRGEDYWEGFPGRVLGRLAHGPNAPAPLPRFRSRLASRAWRVGLVAACVVAGLWLGLSRGTGPAIDADTLAGSATMIREVVELFPNRVRAIVADDTGVRIVLSERADVPSSTPLLIKVCHGRRCQSITTFSGQEIRIAGREFEVLDDARGNVLLVGDHAVWTSAEPGRRLSSLRIEARRLNALL